MLHETKAYNQSMRKRKKKKEKKKDFYIPMKYHVPLMRFTTHLEKQKQSIHTFKIQYMNN